jgi:spore maturation protein CgeB
MHEWNDPALVSAVGARRRIGGRFRLLFHDTHHRAVTDPRAIGALDLDGYDGVLAFGATLAEVYRRAGWGNRAFVWHEAADTSVFHPPLVEAERQGAVWIGNWGDDERSEELQAYLLDPLHALDIPLDIYGVRYPPDALAALAAAGARYHGWLPNARAPEVFARHLMTVHVPRRAYATQLPGIPTIRVFEALACGIPLICAPWSDSESLFRQGRDYLLAPTPEAMRNQMASLRADPDLRRALVRSGLETIRTRHTCAHRVDELLAIVDQLGIDVRETAA